MVSGCNGLDLSGDHGQALLIHSLISCLQDKPMVIMDKSDHGQAQRIRNHFYACSCLQKERPGLRRRKVTDHGQAQLTP